MKVPNQITKGVTVEWTETSAQYPASVWDMSVVFVNPTSTHSFNATANGDDHDFRLSPADSSALEVGRYDWQAFVTDGTDRYCVGSGTTQVAQDFAATVGFDGRSQLQQIVDAIDAYLLGNATKQQQKTRFGDREIWNYDRSELMTMRSQLKRELAIEKQNEAAAKGLSTGQIIRTVFR